MPKIGKYVFEEISRTKLVENPSVLYEKLDNNPFEPIISENICVISTKFLREIMEDKTKSLNKAMITDVASADKWKFSRDHFTEDDWNPI